MIPGVGVQAEWVAPPASRLEIGPTGGIRVDQRMQRASDRDIYAAGDCVECSGPARGRPCYDPS